MHEPPQYGYQVPPLSPIEQPAARFGHPADPLISADYGGWWQRSTALVKAYWKPLALLQLIAAAVSLLVRIPFGIYEAIQAEGLRIDAQADLATAFRELARSLPALGVTTIGSLLAGLVVGVIWLAGMRLMVVAVTGGQPMIGDALRGALRRLFPLAGWGMLAYLIVLAGVCCCVLPSIYFSAVFAVLPAVVLFERGGVIGRCFKLFHADLGASIARVATIAGLGIAATLVGGLIGGIAAVAAQFGLSGTGGLVAAALITTVISVVTTAAISVLLVPMALTTYADERARLEPLHTGVLAHELANA